MTEVTDAYAARADDYAKALGSMDAVHPSDRQLVDSWSDAVTGRMLDAGCGPGHWTAYLARRGFDVRGIDLVPAFLAHARAGHPGVRFDLGDIDDIDEADASLGGVLSWFSTIHHEPRRITAPIAEFARILRPHGLLLMGFFDGAAVETFDHAVVCAYRWPAADLHTLLDAAGFDVLETHRRSERNRRPVGAILCRRR